VGTGLTRGCTYNSPDRLVETEALLKDGHVVEPCSEMQVWAAVAGSDAARTARAKALFATRGRC